MPVKFFSINKYGYEADSPASALRKYAHDFLERLREGQSKTIQIVRMGKAEFDSVFEDGTSLIEDYPATEIEADPEPKKSGVKQESD